MREETAPEARCAFGAVSFLNILYIDIKRCYYMNYIIELTEMF